jgi:hypothetical protein
MTAPRPSPASPIDRPGRGYRAPLPPKRERKRSPFSWRTVAGVLVIGCIAWFAIMWAVESKSVGVALVEIPFLLLLTAPLFMIEARRERRFDLAGLMATGLALRFAASYYRFTHAADASTYHNSGIELAKSFRRFNFSVDPLSPVPGTGGMKIITGVVEVLTNSNAFATFLVFSWLGFLGCYLFYRAFVIALPDGWHYRYALLIFLWPTLLLWPSSIGKDCWMLFTLGIAALGAARVLKRQPGGYSLLLVGTLAGSFVRPHVALLLVIAFAVALVIGRRQTRPGAVTPGSVGKIAGLVVILVLGSVLATRTADLLKANDVGSSVDAALLQNSTRTSQGGSAFHAPNPKNPIGYVEAAVTVVFRPFPIEAHGLESIASSIEGLFLLALALASWRRLASIPRQLRGSPYTMLAIAYMLMFVFAFGTIANFGILARERSQLMPFVFVLLCVPLVPKATRATRVRRSSRVRPELQPLRPRIRLR